MCYTYREISNLIINIIETLFKYILGEVVNLANDCILLNENRFVALCMSVIGTTIVTD